MTGVVLSDWVGSLLLLVLGLLVLLLFPLKQLMDSLPRGGSAARVLELVEDEDDDDEEEEEEEDW